MGNHYPKIGHLILSVLCLISSRSALAADDCTTAEVIYSNATVITMEADSKDAEALATCGEKIIGVGTLESMEQLAGPSTTYYDLDGRTVVPGFIDSHSHLLPFGLSSGWIDVSNTNPYLRFPFEPVFENSQITHRLTEAYVRREPLLGAAYDPTRMNDDKLKLDDLDKITTDEAIFLWQSSMHAASINSCTAVRALLKLQEGKYCCPSEEALAALQDKTTCTLNVPKATCQDPSVEDKFCEEIFEGTLEEQALMVLVSDLPTILGIEGSPEDSAEALKQAAIDGVEQYARVGYTTASDIVTPELAQVWRAVVESEASALPVDLVIQPTSPDLCQEIQEWEPSLERLFLGPVKIVSDGSPQGGTAFMHEPYFDNAEPPNYGALNMDVAAIEGFVSDSYTNGCRVAIHQNGDHATDVALDVLEKEKERAPGRPVLIHSQFADQTQLARMENLEAIPTFLIQHPHFWGDALCRTTLGSGRTANYDPTGWARDLGLDFTFHHDAFVTPLDPMQMIWAAVTREVQQLEWNENLESPDDGPCPKILGEQQKLTIEEALKALTMGAALQWEMEGEKGSIKTGKIADLAILSDDPRKFSSTPKDLLDIRVLATVHRGQVFDWRGSN